MPRPDQPGYVEMAPKIARDACGRWDALGIKEGRTPSASDLQAVWDVANDATNHNLAYGVFRDHISQVRDAVGAGDSALFQKRADVVHEDCARIRNRRYPSGLSGAEANRTPPGA